MKIFKALAALFAIALASCAPVDAPGPGGGDHVQITLTRTVCFGFCPDYSVTVTSEGDVRYIGRSFVSVVGEQRASVPRADVERLIGQFDQARFESLRDAYRAQVTDLPTYTLVFERNGRRKTVVDYGGVGAGMPEAVRTLQDEVDRVAGTARWVLRDGQPVRTPPAR